MTPKTRATPIPMTERAEALIRDAAEERKLTANVIRGIYEVGRHKDYLEYGCDSLHQFCEVILKYDPGSAYRRVKAANLLAEVPKVAEKLESGELSLTNAATVSRVQEKARKEAKVISTEKLVELVTNTETRTAERKCMEYALECGLDIDPEKRQYDTQVDDLLSKLSHKYPGLNKEALLRLAIKEMHARYCAPQTPDPEVEVKNPGSRYRPKKLDAAIEARNGKGCSHVDPGTGRRCDSRHQLEVDHIVPLALGGKTELSNLRLYCRKHNQAAARALGLRRPIWSTSAQKSGSHRIPIEAPHSVQSSA